MSSIAIALGVLACALGALALGIRLNAALPGGRFAPESRDSLKAAMGAVSMLTALVLGLLVASAKASYDAKYEGITRTTIDIVLLDRALARYGTETAPARSLLREATVRGLNALWSESALRPSTIDFKGMAALGQLDRMVRELKPANDEQRAIQSQAQALGDDLGRSIMLTLSHAGSTIPAVFLFVLAAWLAIFFTGIGLMTPRNAIAVTAVVAAAFTFSTAVFLILELDTPYHGVIQLSDAPLRLVLQQLAQ